MNQGYDNPYSSPVEYGMDPFAAAAAENDRVRFIRNTYLHLAGAVFAFAMIEMILFTAAPGLVESISTLMMGSQMGWLVVLGAFMAVSYVSESMARSNTSVGTQYAGLSLFVVGEAIIFIPLLFIADRFYPGSILSAGVVTTTIFGGLSAIVFITKTDFSFLRYGLYLVGIAAMALIAVSLVGGFDMLGAWFTWAMILLCSGYILYHTSNMLHHYRTDQHVAAALALFSSVAMLFWYILQLFMGRD